MCFSDLDNRFDTPLHYTQTTFNIFVHVVTPPYSMQTQAQSWTPTAAIKPGGGCTFQTLPCGVSTLLSQSNK